MAKQTIVILAVYFMYYNIGGLATTNIMRLTAGNTLPVLSSNCVCGNCGSTIPPHLQLPIISYLICRGHCRICGIRIPVFSLALEFCVSIGMCVCTSVLAFSPLGVAASFIYYEVIRVIVIALLGPREQQFFKQYLIAIGVMPLFALPVLFASVLYSAL